MGAFRACKVCGIVTTTVADGLCLCCRTISEAKKEHKCMLCSGRYKPGQPCTTCLTKHPASWCHNCMSPYIAIDGSECPVCTQRERPEGGESEEAKCECGYETNRDVMCAHSKWCPLSDDKG